MQIDISKTSDGEIKEFLDLFGMYLTGNPENYPVTTMYYWEMYQYLKKRNSNV